MSKRGRAASALQRLREARSRDSEPSHAETAIHA